MSSVTNISTSIIFSPELKYFPYPFSTSTPAPTQSQKASANFKIQHPRHQRVTTEYLLANEHLSPRIDASSIGVKLIFTSEISFALEPPCSRSRFASRLCADAINARGGCALHRRVRVSRESYTNAGNICSPVYTYIEICKMENVCVGSCVWWKICARKP